MAHVAGLVLPFFGLIFIGYLAARLIRQPIEALGWMNIFVVYVALPALFFQLIAETPVERLTEWRYVAGVVLATYAIFSIMFLASMIASRGAIAESTIKGLAASYGNIGYMGPGLVLLAFGPEAAVPVALIFSFENIVHFTVAPMMMAIAGGRKEDTRKLVLGVIRSIVLHPFILATAAGVAAAFFNFQAPLPLDRLLEYLAGAAAPCALFAMGVTLALRPIRRVPRELGAISLLKLVVHPLICYVLLSLVGDFPETWLYTAVLMAALPSATNVYVIAQHYGVWVERASASVLITTALSVLTVTGLLYAITNGYVPPDLFP
ncbi:AEC family transporter [Chelativorans salis]|uniref:AEC family transporter n=1 Tax=Chelativorans salis TaxID=2978478 RepID=A0ABT2LM01_9HYPH|nr:AEC family transporter [Chelativorans sp. EGI FJ00035]MCT7375414.1 AEC family transporter [Chelativorans sp. EGI FJ00035]